MAIEYDLSTRAVCRELGIELVEIPDWNCCGSSPAYSFDPLLSAALAGRNLALAAKEGLDTVMTPCPGCLKALKGALKAYHNPKKRDKFLELLGTDFDGNIKAVSVVQLLMEDVGIDAIKDRVVKPLTGLSVAPYYGCIMTRPAEFAEFDDPENPVSLDQLIEAAGGTVPDFPFKTECCGAASGVTRNEIAGKLTGRILDMARRVGAQMVTVACPLCQQNLDLRQHQVNRRWNTSFDMPVLYITQVIGLALGIESKKLGMDKLIVNADSLLASAAAKAAEELGTSQAS